MNCVCSVDGMTYQFTHAGQAYEIAAGGSFTLTPVPHALQLKSVGDEPYYESLVGAPRTALIHLHAWSGDLNECLATPEYAGIDDCVWVCPNFGGLNNHPQGAGHPAQMERIKRVIDKVQADYAPDRVILVGGSGGGYSCLMVLGVYPGLAQGASIWVPPHDLAAWYWESPNFRESLDACFGGSPSGREAAYLERSPKGVLANARDCIVYVNGGALDDQIHPHHAADAVTQLSGRPGVSVHYDAGPNRGHVIDRPVAVIQINAMITATA
jgi:hypothetical protein